MVQRRRAVALARHFRESEGLSIAQIAERLGRSPATVKAYFYDPTGEKARAVKARYVGVCRGCGAYTQPRNGKGDAYAYCKRCHPGAIRRRWTHELVMARCANGASSTVACRRRTTGRARTRSEWREAVGRLAAGLAGGERRDRVFGTWDAARGEASRLDGTSSTGRPSAEFARLGSNSISLPKPRQSTGISEDLKGGRVAPG